MQTPARELTLIRIFDAPRDLVFEAWTNPQYLAKWWGPDGFTNPACEFDARPGGKIRIDMQAPYGVVYPMTGTVHEIVPPSRLVFTAVAEDHDGNALLESRTIPATRPCSPCANADAGNVATTSASAADR